MNTKAIVSDDDFLLRKVVPIKSVKRIIDWQKLGITKEYIKEQSNLKYSGLDDKHNFIDKRVIPEHDSPEEDQDRFYVTEMCMPYNPSPDEHDVFVYYNALGPLCGDAGYLRIRKGYVDNQRIVIRS